MMFFFCSSSARPWWSPWGFPSPCNRRETVDLDVPVAYLPGQRSGKTDETSFGRDIMNVEGLPHKDGRRGDADYLPLFLRLHKRNQRFAAEE
jgi:hypothetical protein